MADDDSDGSDEWGMEELVIPPPTAAGEDEGKGTGDGGDDYWKVEPTKQPEAPAKKPPAQQVSEPMIIVDMTMLDSKINSEFDKNAVSDADAASKLRKKLESDYETYAKNNKLLADGTVVPCGSTVWRDALVRLRDERPGHYFAPIFPPKSK